MDDLTITRLCAEAMRYHITGTKPVVHVKEIFIPYDPLHNDEQAMALVKKFKPQLYWRKDRKGMAVMLPTHEYAEAKTLNRAICECVAKFKESER